MLTGISSICRTEKKSNVSQEYGIQIPRRLMKGQAYLSAVVLFDISQDSDVFVSDKLFRYAWTMADKRQS
jgi:hypothetical protein